MPHVLDVPGRSEIEIHRGNTTADTEGCILVGMTAAVTGIINSHAAFQRLYTWLGNAARYHVLLQIVNPTT